MLLTLFACGTAGLQDVEPQPDRPHAVDTAVGDDVDSPAPADTVEPEDTVPPEDTGPDVDPDPRHMWLLPQAERAWTEQALDPDDSPHAPITPIQAAFGVPDLDRLWVLTDATYHVLRTDTWAWIDSGDRNAMFPEVAGETLSSAEVVPAWWGGTTLASVYLQVDETAWVYTYDVETGAIELDTTVTLDAAWSGTLGPAASTVSAGWLAVDETAGWAPGNPSEVCDTDATSLGPYLLVLTDAGTAHTWDAGYCAAFVDKRPADQLSVFTFTGAPDPADVVAIDWTGSTLVAFTER